MFIKNKVAKNAWWIIVCRVAQSVLGLVVTMLSARYLGPSGYGLINYAASIVTFVTPIMKLGLNATLVREIVEQPEKEGESMGTALVMSSISAVCCILGVVSFTAIVNHGERDTIIVCALYSILLIFQSLELLEYWFQAKLKSKYTSVVMLIAYIVTSTYKIILLMMHCSIYWFALSAALDYFVIAVGLFFLYRRIAPQRLTFSMHTVKRMFTRSRYYIISDLMITIFAQTDRIMLKLMISDEATGYYSAAVACANLTSFVFVAIIDSMRPMIFEKKEQDEAEMERSISKLYSVIIYLSLLQCIGMTVLAPLIIKIIYGAQYAAAVNPLRLIVWYTTFSYLGSVRGIWILAKEKQRYLWALNGYGAALNVVLNWILIPVWGVMGAAFASLITQIFTNVIMNEIFRSMHRNNILMLKGLNPKLLVEMLKNRNKE